MQIRKNDSVMVIAGKERGKTGKVLRVLQEKNAVIIERINIVKRHTKPRGPQQSGRYRRERSGDQRLQHHDDVRQVQRAGAHRPQGTHRRQKNPHLPPLQRSARLVARPVGRLK